MKQGLYILTKDVENPRWKNPASVLRWRRPVIKAGTLLYVRPVSKVDMSVVDTLRDSGVSEDKIQALLDKERAYRVRFASEQRTYTFPGDSKEEELWKAMLPFLEKKERCLGEVVYATEWGETAFLLALARLLEKGKINLDDVEYALLEVDELTEEAFKLLKGKHGV